MNAPESVLEKIRKLLRLSESPNRHEAELALQRAAQIAAKHQLDLSQVRASETENGCVRIPLETKALTSLDELATWILQDFFHVLCIAPQSVRAPKVGALIVYGAQADCAIAAHVFAFLKAQAVRCWDAYRREQTPALELDLFISTQRRSEADRNSFLVGFFHGVHEKMSETISAELPPEYALVVADKRTRLRAELAKRVKLEDSSRKIPLRDAQSANAGFKQGKETQIRKAVAA